MTVGDEGFVRGYIGDNVTEAQLRKLWQSVLLSAWSEASGGKILTSESEETKERYRKEAREWLTTDGEDLFLVCESAGIEFASVVSLSRKKFGGER